MAIKKDSSTISDVEQVDESTAPPPPSYAAVTAGTSTSNPQPQNHTQPLLFHPSSLERGQPNPSPSSNNQWSPPQTSQELNARVRKRFILALLWGFGIWMLIGMLIGGGVEDGRGGVERGHGHRGGGGSGRERNDGDREGHHYTRTFSKVRQGATPTPIPVNVGKD